MLRPRARKVSRPPDEAGFRGCSSGPSARGSRRDRADCATAAQGGDGESSSDAPPCIFFPQKKTRRKREKKRTEKRKEKKKKKKKKKTGQRCHTPTHGRGAWVGVAVAFLLPLQRGANEMALPVELRTVMTLSSLGIPQEAISFKCVCAGCAVRQVFLGCPWWALCETPPAQRRRRRRRCRPPARPPVRRRQVRDDGLGQVRARAPRDGAQAAAGALRRGGGSGVSAATGQSAFSPRAAAAAAVCAIPRACCTPLRRSSRWRAAR